MNEDLVSKLRAQEAKFDAAETVRTDELRAMEEKHSAAIAVLKAEMASVSGSGASATDHVLKKQIRDLTTENEQMKEMNRQLGTMDQQKPTHYRQAE